MRAELTGLRGDAALAQQDGEALDQGAGNLRQGGAGKGWSPSFTRVCVQGELRDDDGAASGFQQGEVEFSVLVSKDAQIGYFFDQPAYPVPLRPGVRCPVK